MFWLEIKRSIPSFILKLFLTSLCCLFDIYSLCQAQGITTDTLHACTRAKVIGSVRLSVVCQSVCQHEDLNIQPLIPVLTCDELSKMTKKMLSLCSQALCIASELYKSLAVVDHAYRPNLLLQLLLHMLKLCIKLISQNIS